MPNAQPVIRNHLKAALTSGLVIVLFTVVLSFGLGAFDGNVILRSLHEVAVNAGLFQDTVAQVSGDDDNDGYAGTAQGGTDCYDELYAYYKDNVTGCDSTADAWTVDLPDHDYPVGGSVEPTLVADHTWIKKGNTWHLFFQDDNAGDHQIEHYTTTDFKTFTRVGFALGTSTSDFDSYGLWAPHVVESNGTYYMFYTGVTGSGANPNADQRIGLATSTDLVTWTKVPDPGVCNNGAAGAGCIYQCEASWTTWGRNTAYDEQCRDPYVIWDATNSRWVMFVDSKHNPSLTGVITVAYNDDITNYAGWTSAGYINATRKLSPGEGGVLGQLTGTQAENPMVTEYNGTYYLWFNDWEDTEDPAGTPNARTQQQYVTSTTLAADSSGSSNWTYQGYTPTPGVNATEIFKLEDDVWVMSQSMTNGNVGSQWSWRDLILQRVTWNADGTFGASKLIDPACRIPSASINPGQAEICGDNVDNNCSGAADEGLYCAACTDADGDGYGVQGLNNCSQSALDCNDGSAVANPGATEVCDAIDNDCDGQIDEGGVCLVSCTESWTCGDWSACSGGTQTRTCTDANACGTTTSKPAESQACEIPTEDLLIALPTSSRQKVTVMEPDGTRVARFQPFGRRTRTLSVAAGDVTGDTATDFVAGSGRKSRPKVRVFDRTGKQTHEFTPFSSAIRTGVLVAVGNIDGDGTREILAVPGSGQRARVETFQYDAATDSFTRTKSFEPFPRWKYGLELALGDLDGDGVDELAVARYGRSSPKIRIFSYDAGTQTWTLREQIQFFGSSRRVYGRKGVRLISLTVADVNGDGRNELVAARGRYYTPLARIYDADGERLWQFRPVSRRTKRGLVVTGVDRSGDAADELAFTLASGRSRRVYYYRLRGDRRNFTRDRRENLLPKRTTTRELESPN